MKETTSITRWSKKLKTSKKLAIFCGIESKDAPAVGTYYEFFKRLENGPFTNKCPHRIRKSEQRQARSKLKNWKKKPEKTEEEKKEHGRVIKKYVEKVQAAKKEPLIRNLETCLNEILAEVGVKPSADKGLIKDLQKMRLLGDGSTLPSASNSYGKTVCSCDKRERKTCSHKRKFSDIDASWGWDNRIKGFVYGYRYFQLVANDAGHDLPVYLNIAGANTHEAKMAIDSIDRLTKMGFQIERTAFDALFDIYAFYDYLFEKNILYAIPYKTPPAKVLSSEHHNGLTFNQNGVPLCPEGIPMKRHNVDRQGRTSYHCPIKRMARRDGTKVRVVHREECPRKALCEPHSKVGPFVYISSSLEPRLHPKIPRDSAAFYQLTKLRSSAERSNAAKKHHYSLKITLMRVLNYVLVPLTLISILEHSRTWAKKLLAKNPDSSSLSFFLLPDI